MHYFVYLNYSLLIPIMFFFGNFVCVCVFFFLKFGVLKILNTVHTSEVISMLSNIFIRDLFVTFVVIKGHLSFMLWQYRPQQYKITSFTHPILHK